MKRSSNRILTTHAGSLPRPDSLIAAFKNSTSNADVEQELVSSIDDIVARQKEVGIDIANDGEFGKAVAGKVDYGAWWSYVYPRLSGYKVVQKQLEKGRSGWNFGSKERQEFAAFYQEGNAMSGKNPDTGSSAASMYGLVCVEPVKYIGQELVARDIRHMKDAAAKAGLDEVFMPVVAPAILQIIPNEYYASNEEYTFALADAIREEYSAIVDAGLLLQIDDPGLVCVYDWWFSLKDDWSGYRKWAEMQIEALRHALKGIPEDRIRYHLCWGSWHGPHKTDVPLKDIVDLLLKVPAQAYSIEAANVRHEHEWKVWRDVAKLPDGKILIPGVVSHATNVLEHPELIADRIIAYANIVGRENVIAGTDCGLGGRIHDQLVWEKLRVMREGADLASKQLWR